ncbi:MAG: orotidine-5'-phosphate decarboxylase [Chloroflexota bacterium]
MNIIEKYNARADAVGSLLCVGLDSDITQIPARFQSDSTPQFAFNRWIIDQTQAFTSAYKLNAAFYEARGEQGWHELRLSINYLRENYPDVLTICDAKRGDNSNSNTGYVKAIFDELGFDAITLHPYMGREALQPFLKRVDKGAIILCRTSNSGAGELQDLQIDGRPLWQVVAEKVIRDWNVNGNCMLVVGATYPSEMRQIRAVTGDMTFLVPGIGAQGGDVDAVVEAGLNSAGKGLILTASRSIIFADHPGEAAQSARDQIKNAALRLAR